MQLVGNANNKGELFMFKRNSSTATALSAFAFTTLCLLCSAPTATAQVVPQEGAINTSRSNLKSARNDLRGQINIRVEVARYGGAQLGSGVQTQWKAYEIDKAGNFNLGVLPVGQYELRITRSADADKAAPPDKSTKKAPEEARAPSSIAITLDGVKGGSVKRDLALTSKIGTETARTLGGRIDTIESDLSGRLVGPESPKNEHILFEADGTSEVKGTARHTAAMNSIRNM